MKVMSTDGEEYTIELGADLKGAYLIRADLTGAKLKEANLCCAVWNDETVFPEGFEIPEKSET